MSFLKNIAIFGGLGYLGYKLINQGKLIQKLEIGISYLHIDKTKTNLQNGLTGTIGMSVYNPSEVPIPYKKFIGNLFYNDSILGNLDSPTGTGNISILPRKNTIIKINYSIPWSALGLNAVDILKLIVSGKKAKIQKQVSIQGLIHTIVGVEIPVSYDFNLKDYI